jgi:hypothetical protein
MASKYGLALTMAIAGCVVAPPSAPADSLGSTSGEVHSESGLYRVQFHVAQGTIRVNYPDDMAVGDTISGTVYTEPAGKNQKEQDQNSGELAGYVIEMENQKIPSSEKHFQWGVPVKVIGGGSSLVLRDPKGKVVARAVVPVDPAPVPFDRGGFDMPNGAQAGSLVSVTVPATGDLGSSVSVGGQAAPVIAESPRKLVFLSPPDISGPSTLRVTKNGASAEGPYRSLGLQLSATKRTLTKGETAAFSVVVSGLQGSKEPTSMIITNHSPQVVNLSGGPVQNVTIQPAEVRPDGTYQLTRALTGEAGGAFDISVVATGPPASQLPLARLADRTIERWSQTNHISVSAQARSLIESGIDDARAQLDEFLRSQMAWHADPVSLFDWMVRDYCFDLRDQMLHSTPLSERRAQLRVRFANALLQQAAANVVIDTPDVRRFSFSRYLANLLARLTPSQPVGRLKVDSQPANQAIKIDSFSGENYFTTRTFVVSVGTHNVVVSSCQEVVSVSANQGAAVSCPRQ